MKSKFANKEGQMTVELAVAFPVLIIVAVVMVNALSFAGECARFDRISRNSLRTETSTPSIDESTSASCSRVKEVLDEEFRADNESVEVSILQEKDFCVEFECELKWYPTLFGMGLKSEVFGVHMLELSHKNSLVIDPHRAGDVF